MPFAGDGHSNALQRLDQAGGYRQQGDRLKWAEPPDGCRTPVVDLVTVFLSAEKGRLLLSGPGAFYDFRSFILQVLFQGTFRKKSC